MKKFFYTLTILTLFIFTSCDRSSSTWENVKTAGRYMQKSFDSLWGKEYNSEWIQSEDEFSGPDSGDFIALNEKDLRNSASSDKTYMQPKKSFGDLGSGVPGFSNFKTPSNGIFKIVHFETDDHVVRGRDDLATIQNIITYLKKHPKAYLCIEGHCDERASAAYNMALGTRRANHIRVLMIKQGIDFNRIYTISKGKENPIAMGHTPSDWNQNRRGEFKIYEKQ
ncbi:MAG: OmpA family protein [Parachlamydiales bacterium]|nr:OmpA family protein [Parachlamydiales bacterium]